MVGAHYRSSRDRPYLVPTSESKTFPANRYSRGPVTTFETRPVLYYDRFNVEIDKDLHPG